jgi:hypothetical protein
LMIHGVGRNQDGTIDWSAIRRRDGLRDKSNSSFVVSWRLRCYRQALLIDTIS